MTLFRLIRASRRLNHTSNCDQACEQSQLGRNCRLQLLVAAADRRRRGIDAAPPGVNDVAQAPRGYYDEQEEEEARSRWLRTEEGAFPEGVSHAARGVASFGAPLLGRLTWGSSDLQVCEQSIGGVK